MTCLSTDRMIGDADTDAVEGIVRWAPARSLWMTGMTGAAASLIPFYTTPGAVIVFGLTAGLTLCLGHSIGLHRLLIHRSFVAPLWLERILVYLGTLVGMAGPIGMVRLHDMRDWAQRQSECHDLHAHRAKIWKDAWWPMHCRLILAKPPRFVPEDRLIDDRWLDFLEATWMLQQLPVAALLFAAGGWPWVVWGVPVRIAVSVTGHWFVGHVTHHRGPQGWTVDNVAVQGHDWPAAALLTFGEAWHGNHHAWPGSARLGLEPGQPDPGWWVLCALHRFGLVHGLVQTKDLTARAGLRRAAHPAARFSLPTP